MGAAQPSRLGGKADRRVRVQLQLEWSEEADAPASSLATLLASYWLEQPATLTDRDGARCSITATGDLATLLERPGPQLLRFAKASGLAIDVQVEDKQRASVSLPEPSAAGPSELVWLQANLEAPAASPVVAGRGL